MLVCVCLLFSLAKLVGLLLLRSVWTVLPGHRYLCETCLVTVSMSMCCLPCGLLLHFVQPPFFQCPYNNLPFKDKNHPLHRAMSLTVDVLALGKSGHRLVCVRDYYFTVFLLLFDRHRCILPFPTLCAIRNHCGGARLDLALFAGPHVPLFFRTCCINVCEFSRSKKDSLKLGQNKTEVRNQSKSPPQ